MFSCTWLLQHTAAML